MFCTPICDSLSVCLFGASPLHPQKPHCSLPISDIECTECIRDFVVVGRRCFPRRFGWFAVGILYIWYIHLCPRARGAKCDEWYCGYVFNAISWQFQGYLEQSFVFCSFLYRFFFSCPPLNSMPVKRKKNARCRANPFLFAFSNYINVNMVDMRLCFVCVRSFPIHHYWYSLGVGDYRMWWKRMRGCVWFGVVRRKLPRRDSVRHCGWGFGGRS